MCPFPLRSRAGNSAFVIRITPITFDSYISRQFSSSASATGSRPSAPPALLTRTETSGRASATRATESGSVTSRCRARPPASRAISSTRSRRLAAPTTLNPAAASERKAAAPLPLLGPVTRAVRPLQFIAGTLPAGGRHDSLGRTADRLRAAGKRERCESEPRFVRGIQGDLPGDQVAWHPRVAAAPGDLPCELALSALRIETALPGDHRIGIFEPPVEADHSQDERRAEHEMRVERRPEGARETPGGARHGSAARVAGKGAREGDQPGSELFDLLRRGPLLGRKDLRRALIRHGGVREDLEMSVPQAPR